MNRIEGRLSQSVAKFVQLFNTYRTRGGSDALARLLDPFLRILKRSLQITVHAYTHPLTCSCRALPFSCTSITMQSRTCCLHGTIPQYTMVSICVFQAVVLGVQKQNCCHPWILRCAAERTSEQYIIQSQTMEQTSERYVRRCQLTRREKHEKAASELLLTLPHFPQHSQLQFRAVKSYKGSALLWTWRWLADRGCSCWAGRKCG
jgi:hypothetical protein